MDIANSSLAQQLAMNQLNLGQALIKSNAKAEQKTAAILAEAIESAPVPGRTRGLNLDISV